MNRRTLVTALPAIGITAATSKLANAQSESTPTPSEMSKEELVELVLELQEENQELQEENERLKKRIEDMSGGRSSNRQKDDESIVELAIGDTWDGDSWSITVNYFEVSPQLVTSFETNTARGIYAIVHMSIINNGSGPAAFPYDSMILVDGDGREYSSGFEELFNLNFVLFDNGGQYTDLQPGIPYDAGLIYDIPATATGLRLRDSRSTFVFDLGA